MQEQYIKEEGKIFFIEQNGFCGQGTTERGALLDLKRKIFNSKTTDQLIQDFVSNFSIDEVHTVEEWIEIHHEYIGSCGRGAYKFIKMSGLKMYEKKTTAEFLEIVKAAYKTELIEQIQQRYQELDSKKEEQ